MLVVDDEPTIAEIVARYLQRAGYATRVAGDGAQALALCAESTPDLVVLDIMLPGIDGLEVLRRLREVDSAPLRHVDAAPLRHVDAAPLRHVGPAPVRHVDSAPVRVILLTARGREDERIIGLRRGADDYVVKPFSPGELVARVEAVLRRERATTPAPAAAALERDGLRIEPASRRVIRDGHDIPLTQREFDLLAFLAQHPGQVFSRDRLMELVWQLPAYGDSSTVTVHIRRLRAKLEPDPQHPCYVQTVWGVGYRFRP
ncbi:MAG TPA: response regulator transcription factor [Solirubrobacteraceae bacterium]|nr:response regulator transcription factor [Solirubrobacteraceae bacterium]